MQAQRKTFRLRRRWLNKVRVRPMSNNQDRVEKSATGLVQPWWRKQRYCQNVANSNKLRHTDINLSPRYRPTPRGLFRAPWDITISTKIRQMKALAQSLFIWDIGKATAFLLCSLAVLDARVGHIMDVLSSFISVLSFSDSCTGNLVHLLCYPSRPPVVVLACVHLTCFPGIISFSKQLLCFLMVWP